MFGGLARGRSQSLFVRAREDPERFADVYLAYRDQVLRFFARRTLDPEIAFDLMAETFAEMFSGLSGFDGETEAQGRAWMWSIAKNELIDWRRNGDVDGVMRVGSEARWCARRDRRGCGRRPRRQRGRDRWGRAAAASSSHELLRSLVVFEIGCQLVAELS